MKTLLRLLLGFCVSVFAVAQPPSEISASQRSPQELEKLVAPIALYPDALIAIILPASTNSSDVVLAARYLSAGSPADELDAQPWEDSVKSLARYPEVVKWMDQNLMWTRELGEAFAAQPADVMSTIQRLRSDARANGLLQDTPEQKVVVQDSDVSIVPAQDDVIYVPSYDPDVLILRRPMYEPWMTFSLGFATGSWLNYDCDWRGRNVWVYRHPEGWAYHRDWRWHERERERAVHENWRPPPAYWRHREQSRNYGYRPVPQVEQPHFLGHENEMEPHRRWDGDRDDRFSEAQRPGGFRPEERSGADRAWPQQRVMGMTPAGDSRIHERITRGWNPPLPPSANPVVGVPPSVWPAPNSNVVGQGPRVRLQPPSPPAPERIGQLGPREGQYTARQPQHPMVYRREVPASAAPPPLPVQHASSPVLAPQPAAHPAAQAPAPRAADPGRDQRGGYQNHGNGDDGRERR